MDNSGFRAFAQERAEAKREKAENAAAPASEEDRARKKAKQQASYERRMAIQKRREDALAEASRYTDRAAERRKEEGRQDREASSTGERKHWMDQEAEEEERRQAVQSHVGDGPTFAQVGEREDLAAQQHRLSIDKSKYLGGDIEHTHLVKGLDFALLQKIRAETQAADAAKASKDKEEEARRTARKHQLDAGAAKAAGKLPATLIPGQARGGATAAGKVSQAASAAKGLPSAAGARATGASSASGANAVGGAAGGGAPMPKSFETDAGRAIYRAVFGEVSRPTKALLSGRLVYEFDVGDETYHEPSAALPTVVVLGEDEVSAASKARLVEPKLPDGLLERLNRISRYVAGGAKHSKHSKEKDKKGRPKFPDPLDPYDGALGPVPPVFELLPLPSRDKKSRWGALASSSATASTAAAAAGGPTPSAASARGGSGGGSGGGGAGGKTPPAAPSSAAKAPPAVLEEDVDDIFGEGIGSDYKCEPSAAQLAKMKADKADAKALRGTADVLGVRPTAALAAADEEELEAAAPPLAWEDDEGGAGGGGGGGRAANEMVKSLLAKAKAARKPESSMTIVEDEDEMDDAALLKASRGKKAGAPAPPTAGKDVAMGGDDTAGDAYGELLPDAFEGYKNSLELGPDEDEERFVVRTKEAEPDDDATAGGGKGKGGGKGRKGGDKAKLEEQKHEAKMDRELVAIEKLMEERRTKRQKRDEGGGGGGEDGGGEE